MTEAAVFVRDGERYVATEVGLGPWYPGALHGGAPAALAARVLAEAVARPGAAGWPGSPTNSCAR